MKISEIVNTLIIDAFKLSSSDIHFHPSDGEVKIYYRYNNCLNYQKTIDNMLYTKVLRYVKFKTRIDISITKYPQDGSYNITYDGNRIFVRISTIPIVDNESLVMRILPDNQYTSFAEIALEVNDLEAMYQVLRKQNGLFVFTGPTGSGKTTSMYAILNKLVEEDNLKVLTIENPIEVLNSNFVSMQINEEIGITYALGLKAALRQDPDIIMIGEIRDETTARNVFRAALTGHTVISTMHTKNKHGVVERLLDFGFLKSEIQSVLIGVSNQRLIIDSSENTKAVFDYALNDELNEMVENNIESTTIDQKIAQFEKQENKSK